MTLFKTTLNIISILVGIVITISAVKVFADIEIDVDGNLDDWGWNVFESEDEDDVGAWGNHLDIVNTMITDDNGSGSDGNLYIAIEFDNSFKPNHGQQEDVDVIISLDIDGDGIISGPLDRIIEVTDEFPDGGVFDGDGNYLGPIEEWAYDKRALEVSISYSILGLEYGSDVIGINISTVEGDGTNSSDSAPDDGQIIIYDGPTWDLDAPLAVKMLETEAVSNRDGVLVKWTTATEINNLGFNVYRFNQKRGWIKINTHLILGLGNSPAGRSYFQHDPKGKRGDLYKIEDIEFSGSTNESLLIEARRQPLVREEINPLKARINRQIVKPLRGRFYRNRDCINKDNWRDNNNRHDGLKMRVHNLGLHRVSMEALGAKGLDTSGDVTFLQNGRPVPILTERNESWFVGVPKVDRYSNFEVLKAQPGKPLKMQTRRVRGSCSRAINHARHLIELEEQLFYYIASPTDDPFFWSAAFDGYAASINFDAPNQRGGEAEITVHVAGWATVEGPDHTVEIALNDVSLGEWQWEGGEMETLTAVVPAGVLQEAGNQLTIELAGSPEDVVLIDKVDVNYTRFLDAADGGMIFTAKTGSCININGLRGQKVRLFDITNRANPVLLRGFSLSKNYEGTLSLRFADTSGKSRKFRRSHRFRRYKNELRDKTYMLAFENDALSPQISGEYSSKTLDSAQYGADYLIITNPKFKGPAESLAAHHKSKGMSTLVLTTDEVFDRFSGGRPSPWAIKRLLKTAENSWSIVPKFVLLMGGSTVDSNGHLSFTKPDFVPTPFWKTQAHGYEIAHDSWYVDDSDMVVGRLAVESLNEASLMVAKIINWPKVSTLGAARALFIAGRDDQVMSSGLGPFERTAHNLAQSCTPAEVESDVLQLNHSSSPREDLLSRINDGVDLISFNGHGHINGWDTPSVTTTAIADALENDHLFTSFSWGCFDGSFVGPGYESLSWALVRNPAGGAIAAVASTAPVEKRAAAIFANEVICRLSSPQMKTVGEALYQTKVALADDPRPGVADAVAAFTLLGDPATANPWH